MRSWKSEWLTKCNSVCLANEMPIFSTLVLLDPFLLSVPEERISLIRDNAITRAKEKTSSWPSRKAVKAYYSKKRRWDERVREIFIVGVLVQSMEVMHIFHRSSKRQKEKRLVNYFEMCTFGFHVIANVACDGFHRRCSGRRWTGRCELCLKASAIR